ncbi:hypothetical protein ABB55_27785 [Prosthecomicrobium hirschii]|uniref:Portal protein n=1 Tax=Prosthecodimorpha hirschii TaxID=665126 RepID=A0A0P6VW69_9HYPH|nr:phage portal protein [Prosthecomicrobium hirschii]KPL55568.1 hypothetical protein ABB55_27785 [Prosthecomicrobium hirschii]
MNLIDQLVGLFSPARGAARILARRQFDRLAQRDYDAAARSPRTASLRGRGTSANVEIGAALTTLRDRARDFERNNWIGASILDKATGLAVGTGIQPKWETGSDRQDRVCTRLWEEWSQDADASGEIAFAGQQVLAVRSMIASGEVLARMVVGKFEPRKVPLRVQLLEGDHIDSTADLMRQPQSRLGIALGDWDRRLGYWLHPQHPGEYTLGGTSLASVYVPRAEVAHLYRPLRPGQLRGVSWFAPILLGARDYADLMEALVLKARIEACFAGFVESDAESALADILPGQPTAEAPGYKLQPGTMTRLRAGEKVSFAAPSGAGNGHGEVAIRQLMGLAAGVGLTYDQVTGDLRQANYSSLRAGKIEQRRLTEQLQWHVLVPMFLERVRRAWVDSAILAGALKPRADGYAATWIMPTVEPIDPLKDLEADILAVRAGRWSPQEFIGAWGRDWRSVMDDFGAFSAEIDARKLGFDIDPRAPRAKAPSAKASDPATAAADSPAAPDPANPSDPAAPDPQTGA